MSWKIVDEIWDYSKTKGAPKLILLALGRHAHDDGTHAYPSLPTLGRLTNMTVPHIWQILQDLRNEGHILIFPRQGPDGQNMYTVLRPWATEDLRSTEDMRSSEVHTLQNFDHHAERHQNFRKESKRKKEKEKDSFQPAEILRTSEETTLYVSRTSEAHPSFLGPHPLRTSEDVRVPIAPDDPAYLRGLAFWSPDRQAYRDITADIPPAEPPPTHVEAPAPQRRRRPPAMQAPSVSPMPASAAPPRETPPAPPKRTRPRNRGARAVIQLSDKRKVGALCPRGHRYQGQDASLRRMPGGSCVECDREQQRERYHRKEERQDG